MSYFGSCGLFCYDLAGKELWRREMPPAKTPGDFGTGVSPIIADGVVVLLRDEATAPKIVALDVKTGEPRWEKPRTSVSGFGTPAVWKTAEGVQIAAPGYGKMIGYDLASGAEKWFVEGMPSACCTTPVIGDGVLLFAGWCPGDSTDPEGMKMPTYDEILAKSDKNKDGVYEKSEADAQGAAFFDNQDMNKDGKIERKEWDGLLSFLANSVNSAFALSAGGSGDVGKTHLKWRQKEGLPYVPSAIFCQGQYVMVKDGGIVTAYNAADGKRLYRERAVASGGYYASPIAAGGNIYFTTLADGAVTVLKAGAAKPEVVAKNPPLGERVSATPAVADDTLYIRTAGHLYAFAK